MRYPATTLTDGIILIDKPAGPASAEVVRQMKRRLRPARVGHLGTLDPFATGLLPILVGEGTKLAPFIQDAPKVYSGLIALGTETDTLDRTGAIVRTADAPALEEVDLSALAAGFTGEIEQVPPVFSAIKRDGVPLYKIARQGGEILAPAPRRVEIFQLELIAEQDCMIGFTVSCSSGTYIRSLARDLGAAMGSAAHLSELRRIRCGVFAIEQTRSLAETLAALENGHAGDILISLRESLPQLPEVEADQRVETRLRKGDSRALDNLAPPNARLFKVVAEGRIIAVAETVSQVRSRLVRGFNRPTA
jgi:tRNA pseudouridine55 synthase